MSDAPNLGPAARKIADGLGDAIEGRYHTTIKEPSAYAIEAVMVARERARTQILREFPDIDEAELEEYLGPENADVDGIMTRLIRKWRELNGYTKWVKAERADLAARGSRFEAQADRCKAILMTMLVAIGKKTHKLPIATFYISPGIEGLRVTDESKVPAEYVTEETIVVRKIKTAELLDDMKNGVVVDGAELSNPMPFLTIKVK